MGTGGYPNGLTLPQSGDKALRKSNEGQYLLFVNGRARDTSIGREPSRENDHFVSYQTASLKAPLRL